MPYRVMVLDSNTESRDWLCQWLGAEFTVTACELAREALERMKAAEPDLLVLSVDLADMPGTTFLSVLRETEHGKTLPAIAVAAKKSEETFLRAFDLGAEDFLVKPFDPRELVVRCRTVLRRRYERTEHWGAALTAAGIEIDPSQRKCVVAGRRVVLRPREFALLEILMRKAGRVLARSYLLETVWGMSDAAQTRAVDVMVSRLRRSLGAEAGRMIETVSKLGYCFRPPGP